MPKLKLHDDEVKAALRWFARQREGASFFAALHGVVDELGPSETCALHAHNERRTFAANLIAMAETEEHDDAGKDRDERKATPARARASRRAGPAGRA